MTDARAGRPVLPIALAVAAFLLYLLPGLLGPYGPFIDELYYLSCSERLAWGYVDHPPLAPFVLHVSRALLGDGLLALRVPAALAGAAVVVLAGLLARRLGAGAAGRTVASLAVAAAPLLQIILGFYSMNALEVLLWTAFAFVLVEIEERGRPRLWLLAGAIAGTALLNKHTFVVLAAGLGAGMLATPARRHLASRWLWAGALVAGVIFLPNLIWQVANGWPSLEFYRNASLYKQVRVPPLEVLAQQFLLMSPGTAPVWIAGLVFLLRRRASARLRHLGLAYLVLLTLMMLAHEGRPDRISGIYPLLYAAGGVQLERAASAAARRWVMPALAGWMLVLGTVLLPVGVPLLAPDLTARWCSTLGLVPQLERGAGKRSALPQWFADRLGWRQLVDDVAAVRAQLDAADQARVVYFAPSYGHAGALEWLGRSAGLRPVHSTHNTWYLWGPPADPVEVAIVLGDDPEHLQELFEEVRLGGIHDCEHCMPWRDQMPVWIVRRARVRIADQWAGWKHFE